MVAGGNPVNTGTRNVAPNIATTCCARCPACVASSAVRRGDNELDVGATFDRGPCHWDHGLHHDRGATRTPAGACTRDTHQSDSKLPVLLSSGISPAIFPITRPGQA